MLTKYVALNLQTKKKSLNYCYKSLINDPTLELKHNFSRLKSTISLLKSTQTFLLRSCAQIVFKLAGTQKALKLNDKLHFRF